MKKKIGGAGVGLGKRAWSRYRKDRQFYFVYDTGNPGTWKLLDTKAYGVVQLICIDNTARASFMAGFRAGRRSTANPQGQPK